MMRPPRVVRIVFAAFPFVSLFVFPWLLTGIGMFLAGLVFPPLALMVGVLADILYYPGFGLYAGTLTGFLLCVLASAVRYIARNHIMD